MHRITTRYVGPTDTAGSKIIARGAGRQLTVPYDYASTDPHRDAAQALARIIAGDDATLTDAGTTARGYRFEVAQ